MKQFWISIGLMAFVLSLSGCLTSVHPLDGSSDENAAGELLGGWVLGKGDFTQNVGPNHQHLNVFVVIGSTDVMIVGDKDRVVPADEAFNQCSQFGSVCYETILSPEPIVNDLHLISLKDHFSTDEANAYMIMAWRIEDNELVVYEIKDESVEAAVKQGVLSKEESTGNINTDSKQITQWVSSLKAEDLKLYARYERAPQEKDIDELPSLPE